MAKRKNKPPQSAANTRQIYLRSQSDTSQTAHAAINAASMATVGSRQSSEDEGLPIPLESFRKGNSSTADGWTIASTIGTWAAVVFALVGAIGTVVWWSSKMDSGLTSVETQVKDVRSKVEKIADDSSKQSGRLENIERSVSGIEKAISATVHSKQDKQRTP